MAGTRSIHVDVKGGTLYHAWKKEEKYRNKLHEIATIETKLQRTILPNYIPSTKEQNKLSKKESWLQKLQKYEKGNCHIGDSSSSAASLATPSLTTKYASTQVPLQELYASSDDKVQLGYEYLRFVRRFPRTVPMRTVLFHIRRMLKEELVRYQLMADCLQCTTIEEVEATILAKVQRYREHPATFTFDSARAQHEKDALARKQREEGKRKEYEARMLRKAKREKLDDLEYCTCVCVCVLHLRTIYSECCLQQQNVVIAFQVCLYVCMSRDGVHIKLETNTKDDKYFDAWLLMKG